MSLTQVQLAALVGSRICHDLISPIGAINNGIELLGMTGIADGPEVDLISESVGNASARIRFFRVAFGAASDQQIGRSEAVAVLEDMTRGGKTSITYQPIDAQPRTMIRLVFLGILCLESALAYGGSITVTCIDDRWSLSAAADKMNVDKSLWSILADPSSVSDIAPAFVQFALLPLLIAEQGRELSVQIGDNEIGMSF